jgi:hypothetical protein
VIRFWSQRPNETNSQEFSLRVHLDYRIGALARVIGIVAARHAVITGISTKGANHELGIGESYVGLCLSVRAPLHKASLLAELSSAGFSYEQMPSQK